MNYKNFSRSLARFEALASRLAICEQERLINFACTSFEYSNNEDEESFYASIAWHLDDFTPEDVLPREHTDEQYNALIAQLNTLIEEHQMNLRSKSIALMDESADLEDEAQKLDKFLL